MATTLASYVSGQPGDAFIAECQDQAAALVAAHVGTLTVPPAVLERAVLEVGADLFYRRNTRNGISGFDSAEQTPMRISRDPMRAALPLLAPYLGPGIA